MEFMTFSLVKAEEEADYKTVLLELPSLDDAYKSQAEKEMIESHVKREEDVLHHTKSSSSNKQKFIARQSPWTQAWKDHGLTERNVKSTWNHLMLRECYVKLTRLDESLLQERRPHSKFEVVGDVKPEPAKMKSTACYLLPEEKSEYKEKLRKKFVRKRTKEPVAKELLQCSLCDVKKTFASRWHLAAHIAGHENKRDYGCDLCDKKFIQVGHLSIHRLTHFPKDQVAKFTCEVCGEKFLVSRSFKRHMQRKHENCEKNLTCSICWKYFRIRKTYDAHTKICSQTSRRRMHI